MTDDTNKSSSSADARMETFLRAVTAELSKGRESQAIRLFLDGLSHHITSPDKNLLRWLTKAIGNGATIQLMTAFAHWPCYYCKKGLEGCNSCGGHGYFKNKAVCDRCASIGYSRCDFCDGTGWMTYSAIPEALRASVAVIRVKGAAAKLESLIKKPVPQPFGNNAATKLKQYVRILVDLNRVLGVFENGVVLCKSMGNPQCPTPEDTAGKTSSRQDPTIDKLTMLCTQSGKKVQQRLRQIIQYMATVTRHQSQNERLDRDVRNFARRRSMFFDALLESKGMAICSSLDHPFLDEAIERLAKG